MTRVLRCLPLLGLLLLGACQSPSPSAPVAPQVQAPAPQPAATAGALRQQFEAELAAGRLEAAGASLERLRREGSPAAALEGYQRLLADAWLQRSQQALEKGDLNAATTALARARTLMPKAPALTNGLGGALQPAAPADGAVDGGDDIPQ